MPRFLLLFIFIFMLYSAEAQYFSTGEDAASTQWSQMKSKGFTLVFPSAFSQDAQTISNLLHQYSEAVGASLGVRPGNVPVLLHGNTSYPNAMVAWAPKRMEWYRFNSPASYPQSWYKQLALHETRHVAQIEKINSGFTHILSLLAGQQAVTLIQALFVPNWFMEGDAVYTETSLSNTGRGRDPGFLSKLNAQVREKGIYSYAKACFGSYRDYVPDSYELGFHLVGWGRKNFGAGLWERALHQVGHRPFMGIPFSASIKQQTGMGKIGFYYKALTDLQQPRAKMSLFSAAQSKIRPITHPLRNNYRQYKGGGVISDSLVVAMVRSMDDIDRILVISPDAKEKILLTPGYHYFEGITAEKNTVAYAERQFSERWANESSSSIYIYDLDTKKSTRLGKNLLLHSPALSPDAKRLVCVDETKGNAQTIRIFNTETGKEEAHWESPESIALFEPSWSDQMDKICFIQLNDSGKSIWSWTLSRNQVECLLQADFSEKSHPLFYKNFLIFASNRSGNGDIIAMDTLTKHMDVIIQAQYHATQPFIDRKKGAIYFSDYCSDGYMLCTAQLDSLPKMEIKQNYHLSIFPYPDTLTPETFNADRISKSDSIFSIKKYRKLTHLLYPHSWLAGMNLDISNQQMVPGFCLFSQNLLSTSTLGLHYDFANAEHHGLYSLQYTYRGWYPIIDLEADYSQPKAQYAYHGNLIPYSYQDFGIKAGLHLDLQFQQHAWSWGIRPGLASAYRSFTKLVSTPDGFTEGSIQTLEFQLSAFRLKKQSMRDVFPPWSQSFTLRYKNTPFAGFQAGYIIAAEADLYFPSVFKHHSLNVYMAYQERKSADFHFTSLLPYPRGLSMDRYPSTAILISANYSFPVLYPDMSLRSWFYLKRILCKLYGDQIIEPGANATVLYRTIGMEGSGDMHFLGLLLPVNLGLRYGWNLTTNRPYYQLIYRLNFDQLY